MAAITRAAVLGDLQRMAETDVPAPRPDFVAQLEARLFDQGPLAFDPTDDELDLRPHRLAGLPRSRALVAVVLVAILLGIGVGARVGPSSLVKTIEPANQRSGGGDGGRGGSSSQDKPAAAAPGEHRAVARLQGPSDLPQQAVPYYPDGSGGKGSAEAGSHSTSTPAASAPAAKPAGRFTLTASGTPAQVTLSWEKYSGSDFAAYLVLRANAPDNAAYPYEGTGTLMMRRLENRDDMTYSETPKVGTTPHYMIVVVDAAGRELARSNQVEPYALPTDAGVNLPMAGLDVQALEPGAAKS